MPYTERRGNKWRVKFNTYTRHPETGKWVYDQEGGFGSEPEALAYGLDRESDARNNRYVSRRDGRVLMSDYCRTWPQTQDVGHLRMKAIKSMIRLYIEPRWGESAVNDVKASAVRAWKIWLNGQPNIGETYEREIFGVFSMMMDDAVEDGMITSSPVQKKRRRGKYKKRKRERKRDMAMEDVFQLACNALVYWGFAGFVHELMMPFTSIRPGEAFALRREYCYPSWPASDPLDDLGEEDRHERHADDVERYGPGMLPAIRVQWQHQREEGRSGAQLFAPKYESRRTVVLPEFLAELLEMLLLSHDSEWVFLSINGSKLADANYTYGYWRTIADGRDERKPNQGRGGCRVTLPAIPVVPAWKGKRKYLQRHGSKAWLDEDGHSRIAVETRMGHELAGVEGLYTHLTVEMERLIVRKLQERWLRFVLTLPEGWEPPQSPTSLPVDLSEWMKLQVKAARAWGL
jgi:hypothetical protein